MIPGLSGSLLSHDALSGALMQIRHGSPVSNYRWFHTWHRQIVRDMGPSSTARHVYDRVAVPLVSALGLSLTPAALPDSADGIHSLLSKEGTPVAMSVTTAWGRDPASTWREAVRAAIGRGLKWSVVVNGPAVRIFDATHTYSRRFVQFDLEITAHDRTALDFFCALLGADGFSGGETALDRARTFPNTIERPFARRCNRVSTMRSSPCCARSPPPVERRRMRRRTGSSKNHWW